MIKNHIRWLSSREETCIRGRKIYFLYVSHLWFDNASLILNAHKLSEEYNTVIDEYKKPSLSFISDDQLCLTNQDDESHIKVVTFKYTRDKISSAMEWVENNGFKSDIYMLAELVRALDE